MTTLRELLVVKLSKVSLIYNITKQTSQLTPNSLHSHTAISKSHAYSSFIVFCQSFQGNKTVVKRKFKSIAQRMGVITVT